MAGEYGEESLKLTVIAAILTGGAALIALIACLSPIYQ